MSKYDEVINSGPITMKRKGRVTTYKFNLDTNEIEQSKQIMSVRLPTIKRDV